MQHRSLFLMLFGLALLTHCATEPEFERDNPYDVPLPPSDSVDVDLSKLSGANYAVTEYGLQLKLNKNIEGSVRILRKNGKSDFELVYQESNHPTGRDFYDGDIRTNSDIGFPLTYEVFYQAEGVSKESKFVIDVNFGVLKLKTHFEESGSYIVDFDYSDLLLNDGIHLLQYTDSDTTLISAVENNVGRLIVPVDELNPTSETVIVPFKMYQGAPTYQNDKSFFLKPAAPSFIIGTVIDTSSISISWTDNSSLNSKQRIIIDGVPKDLPPEVEEYILKDTFREFDTYEIKIESLNESISKSQVSRAYSVPSLPFQTIDSLEHINAYNFGIHFSDEVEFERRLTFSFRGETKTILNTANYVEFNTGDIFSNSIAGSISYTAKLSAGENWKNVRYRPTIDLLTSVEISAPLNENVLDVRTMGSLLVYSDRSDLYKLDLSDLGNHAQIIFTHTDDLDIVSLSNNNQKTAFSSNNELHLLDITSQSVTPLPLEGSPDIFDITFINEDADLLLSTSAGLFIYSLADNSVSNVSNFNTTNPLVFYGDATETRLVALDRTEKKLYYFNTMNVFSMHLTIDELFGSSGDESIYINNVDHYTTRSNTIGFNSGSAYQFSVFPHCQTSSKCNETVYNTTLRDVNVFANVVGTKHSFVVSNNYYRLVGQEYGDDLHVIRKTGRTNPTVLKINRDQNMIIEFDAVNEELRFYDINFEWRFNNYGNLNR